MTNTEDPSQPAGWYESADGSRRYWTGTEWVTPVAAPAAEQRKRKAPSRKQRRGLILAAIGIVVLALVGAGLGIAAKANADHVALVKHQQQVKAHHDALVAAQEAAAAKQAAQKAQEDQERAARADDIKQLESSVKKTAKQDVTDGVLTGPIIDVTCTPLGGGSTDDLTQKSGTFTCFAANKKNTDGTENGYNFSATMNWDTGEYTWRLGS